MVSSSSCTTGKRGAVKLAKSRVANELQKVATPRSGIEGKPDAGEAAEARRNQGLSVVEHLSRSALASDRFGWRIQPIDATHCR